MADTKDQPSDFIPIHGTTSAPFIYFDAISAHGIMNGAIEVELVARTLSAASDGGVTIGSVCTAHLRCSPISARMLIDALTDALAMLDKSKESKVATSQLN